MQSYVLCSWYNHWTSIIIEDIFCDHPDVLPAVGKIKKVDFFIRGIPYDLKVTYLPEGYIKAKRKEAGGRDEKRILQGYLRRGGIKPDTQLHHMWKQVLDIPEEHAQIDIRNLKKYRLAILEDAKQHPEKLITWLYENQGTRRFDASNRLFLVLIDCEDFFASWELKRAKPLLQKKINQYLDTITFPRRDSITFKKDEREYTVIADMIFVEKNS